MLPNEPLRAPGSAWSRLLDRNRPGARARARAARAALLRLGAPRRVGPRARGGGARCRAPRRRRSGRVRAAVDMVLERAGRIDLLVNNAGRSLFGPLAELPLERIDAVYRTDLRGPLAVAQAVVPAMAKQGFGRIANVGSMVGVVPTPWTGAYCAMKAALHTLSEVLRIEVAPLGIEVIVGAAGCGAIGGREQRAGRSRALCGAGFALSRCGRRDPRRSQASQRHPTEADDFARALADALTRARAPRVVRLGRGSGAMPRCSRCCRPRCAIGCSRARSGCRALA